MLISNSQSEFETSLNCLKSAPLFHRSCGISILQFVLTRYIIIKKTTVVLIKKKDFQAVEPCSIATLLHPERFDLNCEGLLQRRLKHKAQRKLRIILNLDRHGAVSDHRSVLTLGCYFWLLNCNESWKKTCKGCILKDWAEKE